MNKKILELINTTAGQLIFSLLCGCAYFMILLKFIISFSKGIWLMAGYLAPLIICGAALVIIKLIKQSRENENEQSIIKLFWIHCILFVLGIVFTVATFIS